MKRALGIILAIALACLTPARAQDDTGTRLERFLEDSLSAEGRTVTIRGFRGALTGRAELETLTLSDAEGPWLTLTDAVLDWDRAALLDGRLSVEEITAQSIDIPRLPMAPNTAPSPEASGTGLALPNLPVAVEVGSLLANKVTLGASVLGQPVTARIEGALALAEGEGAARLTLDRTDTRRGRIALDASYSNTSTILDLSLIFDEGPDGIAAGLLGLPGAPEVRMDLSGTGPVTNYTADLVLQTDAVERLTAQLTSAETDSRRSFNVTAEGDLRPLMEPSFHPFFGDAARLSAGVLRSDQATTLDTLRIETAALDLEGSAVLSPTGLPRQIALTGALANPDGGPLILPVPGGDTSIDSATLDLAFDAATGEAWTGQVSVSGLQRPGLAAARVTFDGGGVIATGPDRVTVGADFAARDLDFGSPDAAQAFGEAVTGRLDLAWESGAPVTVSGLSVTGETYLAEVSGTIANALTTFDLAGRAALRADRLSAFAGLTGRPFSGSIDATLDGTGSVFSGLIDVSAVIAGQDLVLGEPRLDPYVAGSTSIETTLRRTTAGTFLDNLRMSGDGALISATAALSTDQGSLNLDASLADLAPLYPGLSGPGAGVLTANLEDALWTYALTLEGMEATLDAEGTVTGLPDAPQVTAAGTLESAGFGALSGLAGRPLGGTGALDFAAAIDPLARRVAVDADGTLQDASIDIPEIDRVLAGRATLAVSAEVAGTFISLSRLDLVSDATTLTAAASIRDGTPHSASGSGTLENIGLIAPGLSGPAAATLDLSEPTASGGQALSARITADDISLAADGVVGAIATDPAFSGRLKARADDLSAFAELADRPIAGALDFSAEGALAASLQTFDLVASATGSNLRTGVGDLDKLLAGQSRLAVNAQRAEGTITIEDARVTTPNLTASAEGTIGDDTAFSFAARLADIAPFVPGLSGVVTAEGQAESLPNGRAGLTARVQAPAGTEARVTGDVAQDGSDVNLRVDGRAALGLANRILAPRALTGTATFDLGVVGPPSLDAVSGTVTVDGARLIAPVVGVGLTDITGQIALARSAASVQVDSAFEGGGRISVRGPVALTGNQNADLAIALDDVVLTDPALYRTVVSADLRLTGPIGGGAAISGGVDIGTTEVRIPSGGGAGSAGLPAITHIDEPAAVRTTRARAGLLDQGETNTGPGGVYDLDVQISAPNQIFVRGRGLDAELGGALRLRGTTRDVAPDGRFDLIRGRLDILGRRLEMTSGGIELSGALDPEINLVAETQAEDVDVEIRVEGPASDPAVTFASRPELPEDEVLARLLFGRGLDTLSPLQIARLAAAVATLGSSGDGLLGGARSGIGLADLDVTSSDSGGAAVRAGAYISESVYTDVTVDTEGGTEVQLNLDLSDALTVRGKTSSDGNSGLGVFFERDY